MIRGLRGWHKWIGGLFALFLLVTGATGTLLALKNHFGELKTPMAKAEKVRTAEEIVSTGAVVRAAIAAGSPEVRSLADIERIDYRPKQNVFKVVSHHGYREIQVDGKTGRVLSVTLRRDQFIEDIHDFSFFSEGLRNYWLPIVGVAEIALIATGLTMIVVVQRRKALAKRMLAALKPRPVAPTIARSAPDIPPGTHKIAGHNPRGGDNPVAVTQPQPSSEATPASQGTDRGA